MRRVRTVTLAATALAAAVAWPASADIYTWTDAWGRVNISNVEPPADLHARRMVQAVTPPRSESGAARAAAQASEVEALKARVAELESEVDRANAQASAPPPPVAVSVAPRVVVVTPPQVAYAPPPQVAYAPPPDVAACDPLVFGCPAFGYPVNVVVIGQPRFRRHDGFRGARFHGLRHPQVVPARPLLAMRHRR